MNFKEYLAEEVKKKLISKLTVKLIQTYPGGVKFKYAIPEIGTEIDFALNPVNNDKDFEEDVFNGRLSKEVFTYGGLKDVTDIVNKYLEKYIDVPSIEKEVKEHDIVVLSQYRKLLAQRRTKPNPKGTHGPFGYAVKKQDLLDIYNKRKEDGYFDLPNYGNKRSHDKDSLIKINEIFIKHLEVFLKSHAKDIIKEINDKGLIDELSPIKGVRSIKIK